MAQDSNPPSFIPSSNRRRSTGSSAGSASSQSADKTPAANTPQRSKSASGTSNGNNVVPPPSFAPASSKSSSSDAPASFAPARKRSTATAAPSAPASYPAPARRTNTSSSSASTVKAVAAPRKKKRTARKVMSTILVVVLLLLVALGASLFGAWNWVDGKLNRVDWLTSASDTSSATTWLLLGSDERDGSTGSGDAVDVDGSRTDTILVLTKPKKGNASLISIPRDSLVTLNDQYMKINAVSELGSMEDLVATVEGITGQKIDHVAQIHFGGLQNVVNALDGVDLCYDQDVDDPYSGLTWEAGCHTADGGTALAFARMRYQDANGDFGRNERQRQVISAIIKKIMSKNTLTNFSKLMKVANAGLDSLSVDNKTHTKTLLEMALAFKDATGDKGVTGSVYWTNGDYYVDGVGSSVLLDDDKNADLFSQLAAGTHEPGTVGTLAEG